MKIYNYQGWADACLFAESLGFESIEQGEQNFADSLGVKSFDDLSEHYQSAFNDGFEEDALAFIRSKGYTITGVSE